MLTHKVFAKKYPSFREFEKVVESIDSTTEKGNIFESFVKFYLLFNKDLYEIEEVYSRFEIPTSIKEQLKFELTDYGVDGVYVRRDRKVVAYQAKFRSNRISPAYRELSTFWTESEYADMRLIFTNATSLPKPTRNRKNQLAIIGDDLDLLNSHFFESLYEMAQNQKFTKPSPLTPRPYQEKIITDVINQFKIHDRGKVIAACGTGKTLVSKWIQERLEAESTLFMAPSLSLIKQTIEEWTTKTEHPISFLAVCSDESVADGIEDEDIIATNDALNFPVTTNPKEIERFLISPSDRPKVIFSTYHSVDAISNALVTMDFKFDLAMYDEAHRTAGTKNSNMFIRALDDDYVPIKKRLFLTATERVVTPRIKKHAQKAGIEVFSMDDTPKYGITFSELNFGDAISQGIIANYKVIVCAMEEEEILQLLSTQEDVTFDVEDTEKQTKVDTLLKQIILAKAFKELSIKKVVSYHQRVKIAQEFVDGSEKRPTLKDIFAQVAPEIPDFELYNEHVNGEMPAGYRKDILHTFAKAQYGVLSNAKCLTEGIDVPEIDAIYFADPKTSTVDIIQAIGRALRKPKGKDKTAYILLPVVFPKNPQGFSGINAEAFDTLHSVIQALRDQDNDLAQIIDELNYKNSTSNKSKNDKPDEDLQSKIALLPNNKIRIEEFESSLHFRISDVNRASTSEERFHSDNRASSIKRMFTSIGDYNMEAFRVNLVIPTLDLFDFEDQEMKNASLKLNNNNISHTSRLGAIEVVTKGRYRLTALGKYLKKNPGHFDEIFKTQLLKFYKEEKNSIIFPYRAFMKILASVPYLRKFDFVLCLYPLRDTSEESINQTIKEINYLQQTYTNEQIGILNEQNKLRLLNVLNDRYGLTLGYNDVWTTRGTAYNQFNYFLRHLLAFDDYFQEANMKHSVMINPGSRAHIESLLHETKYIELIADQGNSSKLWEHYSSVK